jgi:hypothetical protein
LAADQGAATALNAAAGSAVRSAAPLPASPARVQSYRAKLVLRVNDGNSLSRSTLAAMRIAHALGGYLVSASSGTTGSSGSSQLRLRIPVRHVQAAILRLEGLGTIVSQNVRITDLQRQVDSSYRRLTQLRATVARLEAQLAQPALTDAQRASLNQRIVFAEVQIAAADARQARAKARLEELSATVDQLKAQLAQPALTDAQRASLNARLQFAKAQIAAVTSARNTLVRNAGYATIAVELTTQKPVVTPAKPSRLGRAAHNVRAALEAVGVALLYAIGIGGPIVLVAVAILVAARSLRRRSNERLLERS